MTPPACIGIYSPGDMGQAVGAVLAGNGLRVVAALEGRSARTRALAAQAAIEDVGSLEALAGGGRAGPDGRRRLSHTRPQESR